MTNILQKAPRGPHSASRHFFLSRAKRYPLGCPRGKNKNTAAKKRPRLRALHSSRRNKPTQAGCSDRPLLPWSTQGKEHGEAPAARPRKARTSAKGASAFPRAPRPVRSPESTPSPSSSSRSLPWTRHAPPSLPPTTAPPPRPRRRRLRQQQHRYRRSSPPP